MVGNPRERPGDTQTNEKRVAAEKLAGRTPVPSCAPSSLSERADPFAPREGFRRLRAPEQRPEYVTFLLKCFIDLAGLSGGEVIEIIKFQKGKKKEEMKSAFHASALVSFECLYVFNIRKLETHLSSF